MEVFKPNSRRLLSMRAWGVRWLTSDSYNVQVMSRVKKSIVCIVISFGRKTLIRAIWSTKRSSVISHSELQIVVR